MSEPQFTITNDDITERDARLLEAYGPLEMARLIEELVETLATHPDYSADTTFAAIWKWLARKDAILNRVRDDIAPARGEQP